MVFPGTAFPPGLLLSQLDSPPNTIKPCDMPESLERDPLSPSRYVSGLPTVVRVTTTSDVGTKTRGRWIYRPVPGRGIRGTELRSLLVSRASMGSGLWQSVISRGGRFGWSLDRVDWVGCEGWVPSKDQLDRSSSVSSLCSCTSISYSARR